MIKQSASRLDELDIKNNSSALQCKIVEQWRGKRCFILLRFSRSAFVLLLCIEFLDAMGVIHKPHGQLRPEGGG